MATVLKSFSLIPLISTVVGIALGAIFVILTWLDLWIYFASIVIMSLLIVNQNFTLVPMGYIGMMSAGVFTKIGWLDPIVFVTAFVISAVILAQQIVSRQFDIGHGTSGQGNQ